MSYENTLLENSPRRYELEMICQAWVWDYSTEKKVEWISKEDHCEICIGKDKEATRELRACCCNHHAEHYRNKNILPWRQDSGERL